MKFIEVQRDHLVGGVNPFGKYARQIGSSSQLYIGENIAQCSKPPTIIKHYGYHYRHYINHIYYITIS